jgi:hypothetical protein
MNKTIRFKNIIKSCFYLPEFDIAYRALEPAVGAVQVGLVLEHGLSADKCLAANLQWTIFPFKSWQAGRNTLRPLLFRPQTFCPLIHFAPGHFVPGHLVPWLFRLLVLLSPRAESAEVHAQRGRDDLVRNDRGRNERGRIIG